MVDFPALLKLLVEGGVEFIIVGGAAATAHGSGRLTLDLDIVYKRSPQNIQRLVKTLKPAHPYLRGAPPGLPFKFDVHTVKSGLNFTLNWNSSASSVAVWTSQRSSKSSEPRVGQKISNL